MSRRYGRRSLIPALIVSAVMPLVSSTARAVPPNDKCPTAEVIPPAGPFPHLTSTQNINTATTSGDPFPSCVTTFSRGIWYSFTPAVTGLYQISTCTPPTATSVDDTVLAIYTSSDGTCSGTLTEMMNGCNDDDCARHSLLIMDLTAGTTYFIVASKWGGGAPPAAASAMQLEITKAPLNDACADAPNLPLNTTISGSLTLAANDYEVSTMSPNCYDLPSPPGTTGQVQPLSSASGRDVAYTFTAPADGSYSFKAQHTIAGGNILVHVAPECPSGPGPHTLTSCLGAANRNGNTSEFFAAEEVSCVPLAAGQTVYVYVDEADPATTGARFTLEATTCTRETEPNDDIFQGAPLSCGLVGSIFPQGEEDYYALGTQAAGTRVFALADGVTSNTTDFDMRITTETDTLEYDDADNSTPWGGASPNIAGCPLPNAASFVRMTHFSPMTQSEPYHLYTVLQPPGAGLGGSSATAEIEPNNTFATANTAPNLFFSGSISTGGQNGDMDMFEFCADEGDLIFLSIDGDPLRDETPLDPAVFLFDAGGNQLIAISDGSTFSSSFPNPGTLTGTTPRSPGEAAVFRAQTTGLHYAGVNSQTVGESYSTGDYLYSIALNCLRGDQLETDLSLSITDAPDPIATEETVDLKIEAANLGPRTAMNATWTMLIPTGTTLVNLVPALDWTCNVVSGVITCSTTCFSRGTTASFDVTLKTETCIGSGPIAHAATITSNHPDSDPSNDTALASTQVNDAGQCDDGNVCTTADSCVAGACIGGPPLDCADGNICTNETCVPGTGCVYTNNTDPCDDANACTTADTCANGACVGGPALVCDDGDDCTDDACDGAIGCITSFNNGPCNDGNQCTLVDTCNLGTCIGSTPVVCTPLNDCQDVGICNPATGACAYYLKPDGTPCNDANTCTVNDACKSGACIDSVPFVCPPPPDACSGAGTCNPMTGGCDYSVVGADLDGDGVGDACDSDIDGDGIDNDVETGLGLNPAAKDSDGDDIDDCTEACPENDGSCSDGFVCTFDKPANTDGDDTIDPLDSDSDNDGESDGSEAGDGDLTTPPVDKDGDGVPDYREPIPNGSSSGAGGNGGSGGSGGNGEGGGETGAQYLTGGGPLCSVSLGGNASGTSGLIAGAVGVLLAMRRRREQKRG